jgi:hypothetical protein
MGGGLGLLGLILSKIILPIILSDPTPASIDLLIGFLLGVTLISLLIYFWKRIFNPDSFYTPIIAGGISLYLMYPFVVKNIPMFINEVAGNNVFIGVVLLILIFASVAFVIRYAIINNKRTLHLLFMSFAFVLIAFTTFAMVIIRSNQNPPMNENEPNTFTELVSYLNREQYGDFPTFKRRFTSEPHQQGVFTNYSSDLDFFWRYQMNHMMTRYLLWNYAGRESWIQDAGSNVAPFNQIGNFFGKILGISFAGTAKDSLFGIPLIIGLLGIYFHFRKDWKMASAFMIMFILLGYLTAFYQNQQQPQPRERDYFYVGAFFVFSIWIAIGIRGIIDFIQIKTKNITFQNAYIIGVIAAGIILIPVVMIRANYFRRIGCHGIIPTTFSKAVPLIQYFLQMVTMIHSLYGICRMLRVSGEMLR